MKQFFLPISIVLCFLSLALLYVGIFTGDKLFGLLGPCFLPLLLVYWHF